MKLTHIVNLWRIFVVNRYLAFGFLFFVVGCLVINSNIIFSNIASGVEFSLDTLFKDDYYYNQNNNYYYSYVNKALVFDYIHAVNAQEEQKEKDNDDDNNNNNKYVVLMFDRGY